MGHTLDDKLAAYHTKKTNTDDTCLPIVIYHICIQGNADTIYAYIWINSILKSSLYEFLISLGPGRET